MESTLLGGAVPFSYRLLIDSEVREIRTGRYAHGIQVRLPEDIALIWSTSDRVGVSAVETHSGGRETTVLIGKDFSCLKVRTGEDDRDTFPNPAAASLPTNSGDPDTPSNSLN